MQKEAGKGPYLKKVLYEVIYEAKHGKSIWFGGVQRKRYL